MKAARAQIRILTETAGGDLPAVSFLDRALWGSLDI